VTSTKFITSNGLTRRTASNHRYQVVELATGATAYRTNNLGRAVADQAHRGSRFEVIDLDTGRPYGWTPDTTPTTPTTSKETTVTKTTAPKTTSAARKAGAPAPSLYDVPLKSDKHAALTAAAVKGVAGAKVTGTTLMVPGKLGAAEDVMTALADASAASKHIYDSRLLTASWVLVALAVPTAELPARKGVTFQLVGALRERGGEWAVKIGVDGTLTFDLNGKGADWLRIRDALAKVAPSAPAPAKAAAKATKATKGGPSDAAVKKAAKQLKAELESPEFAKALEVTDAMLAEAEAKGATVTPLRRRRNAVVAKVTANPKADAKARIEQRAAARRTAK
jgi:hypothetical protein